MIVLDHERVVMWLEQAAKRRLALGIERGAERVLCARDEDHRVGTLREARLEVLRAKAELIDGHGDRNQAQCHQQITDRGVHRVLDDHAVAGAQMGLQHALDRIERTRRDPDRAGGDAVGAERRRCDRDQPGIGGFQARDTHAGIEVDSQHPGAERRQQLGVGEPAREVAKICSAARRVRAEGYGERGVTRRGCLAGRR